MKINREKKGIKVTNERYEKKKTIKCFKCNNVGHIARNCSSTNNVNHNSHSTASSLCMTTIPDNKPNMVIQLNNLKIRALIDTGADTSFLDSKLAEYLKLEMSTENIKISCAVGTTNSKGICKCSIIDIEGDIECDVEFIVVENLNRQMIIGIKALQKLGIKIDTANEEIIHGNGVISRYTGYRNNIIEVNEMASLKIDHKDIKTDDKNIKEIVGRYLNNVNINESSNLAEHEIELHDKEFTLTSRPYRRYVENNVFIKNYLDEMKQKKMIAESNSKITSPLVLVKNKGKIRVCVDYRKLNAATIQKPYPIPHMDELLDSLSEAKYFTALDLKSGYHQIKMKDDDIHKTAFITKEGVYEYNRMPLGLINAPYTFQKAMNRLFRNYLYKICVVYLDDILVFSNNKEEHYTHLELILNKLQEANLFINLEKSEFLKEKIKFLGLEVCNGSIYIQKEQLERLMNIKCPSTIKELRRCLGVFGFFRKFIPNYAVITEPLTNRLRKQNFRIGEIEIEALKNLKEEIKKNYKLILPNFKEEFIIYTDSSNTHISGVLMQKKLNNEMPIKWISRKLSSPELNYTMTEKEMLAVFWTIKKLKVYLGKPFILKTDHQAIEGLMNKKQTTSRLTRWVMEMQEFRFKIKYIPGKDNVFADMLSRPKEFELTTMEIANKDKEMIMSIHEDLGHIKTDGLNTFLRVSYNKNYGKQKLKEIIKICEICKKFSQGERGFRTERILLKGPFSRIHMDVIGPLPKTEKGNKYIVIAIDSTTRWPEAKAIKKKTAHEISKFIYEKVYLIHGAPEEIITDQGKEFMNETVSLLCQKINSKKSKTSAYNPKCNGTAERFNKTLIDKLCKIVNEDFNDWDNCLELATFACRVSPISRIGASPFEILYGRSPKLANDENIGKDNKDEENIMLKIINKRIALVNKCVVQRDNEMNKGRCEGKSNDDLNVNDCVYRRKHAIERENKLDSKFDGPYKVIRKLDKGGYVIKGFDIKERSVNRKDLVKV
ncbi:MAG: reverse transcriptase domain-containing protein [Bacilli bacterium]